MLHYKASEIVQRAMTLANIQNSSFVSATENRQLINDAFWALYQIMIDSGDVFFLKEIKDPAFTDGVYVLPEDFYQLYTVKDQYGNGVLRKNKNTIKNGKCYDIRKRDIPTEVEVIDPDTGKPEVDPDTGDVITETILVPKACVINFNNALIKEIEYYPKPMTLDIEGEGDIVLDIPSNAYYQCMLYYMAIWYKTRQNEDPSAIQALYDEAVANFTDTMKIDLNEYPQMRDVYTRIWR
jgi:hypothetical protein